MEVKIQKTNEEVLTEDRREKTDRRKKETPVNTLAHENRRKEERRTS